MRWLALGLVVILLAGCGGKSSGANEVRLGDGQRVSLDLPDDQKPKEDDIRGAVSGIVVDDAIYPIAGATVRILGRDLETVSDDMGLFVFTAMAPGLFTIEASKEGHATGVGTLNVRSGQVTKAVLMAHRLPYVGPYHTTHTLEEFRSAHPLEPVRYHLVPLDGAHAGVVVESYWEALQAPMPDDALDYTINAMTNDTVEERGTTTNPFRVELAPDWLPRAEYAVRVQVSPSLSTVPGDVIGRTYVTVFYVDPPPAGWSFLEGDL